MPALYLEYFLGSCFCARKTAHRGTPILIIVTGLCLKCKISKREFYFSAIHDGEHFTMKGLGARVA